MVHCQAGSITSVTGFDISSTVDLWSLLSGDWLQYYLSLKEDSLTVLCFNEFRVFLKPIPGD